MCDFFTPPVVPQDFARLTEGYAKMIEEEEEKTKSELTVSRVGKVRMANPP